MAHYLTGPFGHVPFGTMAHMGHTPTRPLPCILRQPTRSIRLQSGRLRVARACPPADLAEFAARALATRFGRSTPAFGPSSAWRGATPSADPCRVSPPSHLLQRPLAALRFAVFSPFTPKRRGLYGLQVPWCVILPRTALDPDSWLTPVPRASGPVPPCPQTSTAKPMPTPSALEKGTCPLRGRSPLTNGSRVRV